MRWLRPGLTGYSADLEAIGPPVVNDDRALGHLPRRSERRHCKDAARALARTGVRHIDRLAVCRGGDAVEAPIIPWTVAVDGNAADRHHAAVLAHAEDRVVASIGNVEVGVFIQGGVARPG